MKFSTKQFVKKSRVTRIALSAVMCLAMIFASFTPLTAAAEEVSEMPDLNRKGSLSITFTYEGKPISDGNEVGIYKVADVVEDSGYKFVWKEDFASIGEMPENLDNVNAELASKLNKFAQEKALSLEQGSRALDEDGNVTFSDLELGLYLVVHTKKTQITLKDKTKVTYTINPFLISVPQTEGGKLIYDISTKPKVSPEKDTVPPKIPPKPPRLPQTGQLWWPVMGLGAIGVLFVCVGLMRKSK